MVSSSACRSLACIALCYLCLALVVCDYPKSIIILSPEILVFLAPFIFLFFFGDASSVLQVLPRGKSLTGIPVFR